MSSNFDIAAFNLNANAKDFIPSENSKQLLEILYEEITNEFANKNPWIYEVSDMKNQLVRGGIKANAYLDGARVTDGVASAVNSSTYNNYGLA